MLRPVRALLPKYMWIFEIPSFKDMVTKKEAEINRIEVLAEIAFLKMVAARAGTELIYVCLDANAAINKDKGVDYRELSLTDFYDSVKNDSEYYLIPSTFYRIVL